jgi:hypothetical protein
LQLPAHTLEENWNGSIKVRSMALAMLVTSAAAFADTVFTDGTFNLASYTQVGPYESIATNRRFAVRQLRRILGSRSPGSGDIWRHHRE